MLVAGLAHRPARAAESGDRDAVRAAAERYVSAHAPEWRGGLSGLDALRLEEDYYRACLPGLDPRRWLCLLVELDPARVTRDGSMEPNVR